VRARVSNLVPRAAGTSPQFVESDGVVSMEAEHFSRQVGRGGAEWRVLPGLGRTGGSVAVHPTTTPSLDNADGIDAKAPHLEYDFTTLHQKPCTIRVTALPTRRIHEGRHLRCAVAIDDAAPAVVNLEDAARWEIDVLRAATIASSACTPIRPGVHTLKIWMMDPGVVLDKIVLDFGGLRPSYLGPPETMIPAVAIAAAAVTPRTARR
jgi:hypothetical protein